MKISHGFVLAFIISQALLLLPGSKVGAYDFRLLGSEVAVYDFRSMTQWELSSHAYNVFSGDAWPKAPNMLYATIYVSDTDYRAFNEYKKYNGGERFESFIKRHEARFNLLLRQDTSSIEEYLKLYPGTNLEGLEIRRIIIIDDNVSGQLTEDSDGLWDFDGYDPTASSYWDSGTGIDYGLLHEWGHAFGKLPDIYALDLDYSTNPMSRLFPQPEAYGHRPIDNALEDMAKSVPSSNGLPQLRVQATIPEALIDIPIAWREYYPSWGLGPIPAGIMGAFGTEYDHIYFDSYNMLQIMRRIKMKRLHPSTTWIEEASWSFPDKVGTDIPLKITYEFDAKVYKNLHIEVYQTDYPAFYPSTERIFHKLTSDGSKLDANGQITIDNLFQNPGVPAPSDTYSFLGMYPAARAVLLFKVYDNQNKLLAFTWSDIRLANMAAWMGLTRHAIITLPMANINSSSPGEFAWTYSIQGSAIPPVFIPLAKR